MRKIEKNWLEWSVFAVSSVLVVGVLSVLAYDGWTAPLTPPSLEVHVGLPEYRVGYYAVPVTVKNQGFQTAEAVQIQVQLTKHDGSKELGDLKIEFVPRQSLRRGFVTFESDPRTAKSITARPLAYRTP